ncbi:unnamed protein product [Spirodela intermedia]|uniref:Uncharacterized protein n=1 Tax=Spirodela intermedia TaxID=51605 RepID=A0A7I8J8W1_SPIIN|nr:unnamed protein product [Spirodela intermedia]CAA6666524.1 unnamed protein product [Spirodela intermedia]
MCIWRSRRGCWWIAAPIVFNILCLYGINSMTQIFVGHLGNLDLSAVAIGLSVISNFSFGFLLGMGSALETLCGQAFGAGQVRMLLLHPLPHLRLRHPHPEAPGQRDDIAELAGRFALWITPQMFANAINFPAQKFLQAQSKVTVLAWIGFIGLVAHVIMLWVFLFVLDWGIVGAAVAFDLTMWIISLAQVAYVVGWCKDAWTGLSSAAFTDLWPSSSLVPHGPLVLTGGLQNAEIAVDSISIWSQNSPPSSRTIHRRDLLSSGSRTSWARAARGPPSTRSWRLSSPLVIGLVCMGGILGLRDHFAVIFTSDVELQRAVANVAYLLAVTMVLNSVQPVISVLMGRANCVAVGGGWQALVAYINLGCYYVFGLPLGFAFGYWFHWGGIWGGMLCGTTAQTLALLAVIWKTNWKAEAAQASTRVQKWGGAQNGNGKMEG